MSWRWLASMVLLVGAAAAEEPLACVVSAASASLPTFLAQIPVERGPEFGFSSADALRSARPGTPYQLHLIQPQALRKHAAGAPVHALLTQSDRWYVPVLVDAQPVAFLVVERDAATCEAVAIGHALLATRLKEALRAGGSIARGRPTLVASLQAREYFLADPDARPTTLRSLLRAGPLPRAGALLRAGPESDPRPEEDVDDVVKRLRPLVEANVAGEAR